MRRFESDTRLQLLLLEQQRVETPLFQSSGYIIYGNALKWGAEGVTVQTLLNFLRQYSEGRQPIHLVKAFENTNGFW